MLTNKQVKAALASTPTAAQRKAAKAATASPMQALALVLAAPVAATAPTQPAAPIAAPTAPPAWASQPWAATLPKSLVAKGNALTGMPPNASIPANLQNVRIVAGRPYTARAHNAVWAAQMATCVAQAQGGATVAQVLAAGVGMHSIKAYLGRGWFTTVPA